MERKIMKQFDILGREVNENDLVVVKNPTKASCNNKQLILGVFDGKNVRIQGGLRPLSDMFLISNPSEEESVIRDIILKEMRIEQENRQKKMGVKIRTNADTIGRVYRIHRDECVLYCGRKKVSVYKNGKLTDQYSGHLYINIGNYLGDNVITKYKFNDFIKHEENLIARCGHFFHVPVAEPYISTKEYQKIQVPKAFEINEKYIQNWYKNNEIDHQILTEFKIVVEDIDKK